MKLPDRKDNAGAGKVCCPVQARVQDLGVFTGKTDRTAKGTRGLLG